VSESEKSQPDELRETYSEMVPALAPPDVFDPVIEAYKKDVDRTLIRENLKLTRGQRLLKLESVVTSLIELRGAVERTRQKAAKQ
jgi:hypothetical protein